MRTTLKAALVLFTFCIFNCNAKSFNDAQTFCSNPTKRIQDKRHSICMRRDIKDNKQGRIPIRRTQSFTFNLASIDDRRLLITSNEMCSIQSFTLTIKNSNRDIIEFAIISTDQEEIEISLPSSLKGSIYITIETDEYIYTGTTNF